MIEAGLSKLIEEGQLRTLKRFETELDFLGNDYLGLANNEEIRAGIRHALLAPFQMGATGSRLLSGNTEMHIATEKFLSELFKSEAALLMNSGYAANLSVMSALGALEGMTFFSDSLNHASLIDGMRMTGRDRLIYRHNDLNHLKELLQKSSSIQKAIVTESVFSMDGDLSPLNDLAKLASQFGAWLVVDEAHATGTFGLNGLGLAAGLGHSRLIVVHTAGKALGAQGAFVTSSQIFHDWMLNTARPLIYSTALSPLVVLQIRLALDCLLRNPEWPKELQQKAERVRIQISGFADIGKSESQIIPVILGSNSSAFAIAEFMTQQGFAVRAIRSPTVPKGQERLRITINRLHTEDQLQLLIETLKEGVQNASH